MSSPNLRSIHCSQDIPADFSNPFSITCPPRTDIWNKPPETFSFNAPIIYQEFPNLTSFKSASVTVSAAWREKYDQGGLCIVISDPFRSNNSADRRQMWLKTGIEFLSGKPHISTVVTNGWSDWSLRPLPMPSAQSATITVESNPHDGSLWVYVREPDGSLSPLREVTWWADLDKHHRECWVGTYAARPANVEETLEVTFESFSIESTLSAH